ncbi:DMT family transporter [Gloeobacter kilaueensis]|uniref:EamA domain-containing protein n=1 Tax=Gloeobacter kilaueensis (strain ATCC BAA-2537 / CCAP 1431/1 / ULC 316 / JS1) TaxID=1183438 RepID=U5QKW8_GLOK1|nr:DMT family transporter [Gloeobacter kilaueensis]AGY59518.1 hypothetical protein GKIL_3272 [Gloeobacter kilaueensis JS1]
MLSASPGPWFKVPGQLFLWIAVIIFAASGAVTRKLTELGAQHLVAGHNPISLCNLLFVGNLCALLVLVPLYRKQLTPATFRQLSRSDWLGMIAVAVLAGALAPAFFLMALSITMVNNVTLVSRLEPLLTLVLSTWLLRERTSVWEGAGAVVSFAGVIATIALQSGAAGGMAAYSLGSAAQGELLTAIAAVALAVANIVSRARLGRVPVGTFSVVRTSLGTVIFFCLALILYGSRHFGEAFSPFLWQWMLLYGTLIVVVGQSLWLLGLKRAGASEAALVEAFNPVAAVLAAYLILGEVPTLAQYLGGGIILAGIALSLIGVYRKSGPSDPMIEAREKAGTGSGFRGM